MPPSRMPPCAYLPRCQLIKSPGPLQGHQPLALHLPGGREWGGGREERASHPAGPTGNSGDKVPVWQGSFCQLKGGTLGTNTTCPPAHLPLWAQGKEPGGGFRFPGLYLQCWRALEPLLPAPLPAPRPGPAAAAEALRGEPERLFHRLPPNDSWVGFRPPDPPPPEHPGLPGGPWLAGFLPGEARRSPGPGLLGGGRVGGV